MGEGRAPGRARQPARAPQRGRERHAEQAGALDEIAEAPAMTNTASPIASGANALPPRVQAHSTAIAISADDAGGHQALRRAEQIAALPRQQRPERHRDQQAARTAGRR